MIDMSRKVFQGDGRVVGGEPAAGSGLGAPEPRGHRAGPRLPPRAGPLSGPPEPRCAACHSPGGPPWEITTSPTADVRPK